MKRCTAGMNESHQTFSATCKQTPVKHVSGNSFLSFRSFWNGDGREEKGNCCVQMCNYTTCLRRSDKFNPRLSCSKHLFRTSPSWQDKTRNYAGLLWVSITLFLCPFISSPDLTKKKKKNMSEKVGSSHCLDEKLKSSLSKNYKTSQCLSTAGDLEPLKAWLPSGAGLKEVFFC